MSAKISYLAGTHWAFLLAILVIGTWLITGPAFGFSDTWQLVINTGTTIVTFLMVFLIQNTQNRNSKAVHLKLDELLKGIKGARNSLVNIEELPDEALEELQEEFRKLKSRYTKIAENTKSQKHTHIIEALTKFIRIITVSEKEK